MLTVYTLPSCKQCKQSKQYMKDLKIEYKEVDLSKNEEALRMVKDLGYKAAPVIVTEDGAEHWSGYQPDRIIGFKPSVERHYWLY